MERHRDIHAESEGGIVTFTCLDCPMIRTVDLETGEWDFVQDGDPNALHSASFSPEGASISLNAKATPVEERTIKEEEIPTLDDLWEEFVNSLEE